MQNTRTSHGVAIASGSFLSGAMMSISLLAVPTCLDTMVSDVQLCQMWERVFYYGHRALPALAVATCGLYLSLGYRTKSKPKRRRMVLAGIATVSIVPFTWIFMFPTNDLLFAMVEESVKTANAESWKFAEARSLVVRWARLHMTRSLFPLIGTVIALMGGAQEN